MKQEDINAARPFERLSRLGGYGVERHHVDPRGAIVANADGRTIGEVTYLIVDTERMVAAYLDVELDTKVFDLHDDPHILVPLPHAHRDGDHHRLRIDGLSRERIASLVLARDTHLRDFWNRWWEQSGAVTQHHDWTPGITRSAPVPHDELKQAIDRMQPGDTVRFPVVNEEIIVEKRPLAAERDADPVLPPEAPPRAL
jgi:hypothetical protein